jgi:hypothetical protein
MFSISKLNIINFNKILHIYYVNKFYFLSKQILFFLNDKMKIYYKYSDIIETYLINSSFKN